MADNPTYRPMGKDERKGVEGSTASSRKTAREYSKSMPELGVPSNPRNIRTMGSVERSKTEGTSAARRRAARKQRRMGPLERKSVEGTTAAERKSTRTASPEKVIASAVAGNKPVTPALARQVLSNLAIIANADAKFRKEPASVTRLGDKPEVDLAQSFFKKSFVRPVGLESRADSAFQMANIAKLKEAAESYLATSTRSSAAKKQVATPKSAR
jgi:hypothetical protein